MVQVSAAEEAVISIRSLLPGLHWMQWSGGASCRSGDPTIVGLGVDPERFRFQIRHYARENAEGPLTLWEWLDRAPALALFNAGQYYPDYSYMGLLVLDGRPVRSILHHIFQGIFAAEPVGDRSPRAMILDLAWDAFDPRRTGYREVAQSFMLLDRFGSIRVQRTQNVANRTVMAEDHEGGIWIFVTQGGYTLWELGQLLQSSPFPILQAMSMDGGEEAQMVVRVGGFLYDSMGSWDPKEGTGRPGPRSRRPLPTVIGVLARDQ